MADRARGGRGGGGGRNRGSYGGSEGRRGGHGGRDKDSEKPKRESILDLSKYMDKKIRVKFSGGREVFGVLKGYDQLLNLVLDETNESLRDPETGQLTDKTRNLGLVVLRGPTVILISPVDGMEEIENPFVTDEA
ncbi:uncharacterized protein VTP21DRAFT_9461 [Calcarisporiella thermophila]|uniref:uncharacterized protein n=1 Tax=Calcarisporiella thermophila TaxID=911321 RepID=UPI003743CB1A